jgi:hypothetical protein
MVISVIDNVATLECRCTRGPDLSATGISVEHLARNIPKPVHDLADRLFPVVREIEWSADAQL